MNKCEIVVSLYREKLVKRFKESRFPSTVKLKKWPHLKWRNVTLWIWLKWHFFEFFKYFCPRTFGVTQFGTRLEFAESKNGKKCDGHGYG